MSSVLFPVTPCPSLLTPVVTERGQIFTAKQRYDAIGSRSKCVLSFEKGEELEVLNPALNSEWWEAISLRTGNRGDVPSSYLVKKGGGVEDREDSHNRRLMGPAV